MKHTIYYFRLLICACVSKSKIVNLKSKILLLISGLRLLSAHACVSKSKIVNLKSKIVNLQSTILLLALFASCDDIYDNIKEHSLEEIIYSAHFDTIYATPGYKRVEIDLMKEGRIRSSSIRLGRASRTVVEYDTVVKRYDSVCSWVNITGLTMPKLYRFKVYTETEDGDRSVPMEVALTPFTSSDSASLKAPTPALSTVSTFVVVRWEGGLTSTLMEFLSLSYSYTDKNGRPVTGTTRNSQFYISNIPEDEEITVDVKYWVYPKLNGEKILDSICFDQPMSVSMAAGTAPIEFKATPSRIGLIPGRAQAIDVSLKYSLSWTSSNPAVATVNANGVVTARSAGTAVITVKSEAIAEPLTVNVTVTDVGSTPAKENLTGMWTFEDASYLEHAAVGLDLEPNNHPRRIVASVAGPKNTKAVRIGTNTYYSVEHSISPNGRGATGLPAERVNEYTLMMDIMVPTGAADRIVLFNPKANNTTDGVLWLNKERQIGSGDLGGFSNSVLAPNIWHRVVVAAKLDEPSLNVYLNGERIWSANTASLTFDGTLSLLPKLHFGYDREGNGYPCPQYAEVRTWSVRLSDAQIRTLGTP